MGPLVQQIEDPTPSNAPFDGVAEELEEAEPVGVVEEDRLMVVATTEDVPGGAGEVEPKSA